MVKYRGFVIRLGWVMLNVNLTGFRITFVGDKSWDTAVRASTERFIRGERDTDHGWHHSVSSVRD